MTAELARSQSGSTARASNNFARSRQRMSPNSPLAVRFHLRRKLRPGPEAPEGGEAKDYADLARLSCLCRERISQIVRLKYLGPDM